MFQKHLVASVTSLVGALFFLPIASATDRAWTPTGNSSNSFSSPGNWDTTNPGSGDRGMITNNSASANQTNSAYVDIDYSIFGGTGDGVVVSNSNASGSGINKLIQNFNHFQMHQLTIGNNGIVEIANGASISAYRGATLSAGGSLILNAGSLFRTPGEDRPNFLIDGTVVGRAGAGNFATVTGNSGGSANSGFNVRSGGKIIVESGTLYVNSNDAFDHDGLTVDSGGTIQVNNGSTFVLNRSAAAWTGDSEPDNNGVILLNGGSFTVHFAGGQASDRPIQNNGTILGSGTLAMRVNQSSTGQTIASNGVLNIFQLVAGNNQTFSSVGGDFGTFKAVSGGTLKLNGNVASGFGGAWSVDNGGTIEVATGNSVDLGSAFIPGSALNGTVRVSSGANLTLSANTGISGHTVSQNGTFLFAGGTITMANVGGLNRFTNTASGVFINDGNGVFRTGHGVGNNNYGILNLGTVIASNGVLTLYSDDAANAGGFQNQGTVRVLSGGTLTVTRSDNAWVTGVVASPTNLNLIAMEGGTLRGSNTTVGNVAGRLVNASTGSITGGGTFTGFSTYENSGTIVANSSTPLTWAKVAPANPLFLVNNSSGVISANTARVNVHGVFTNAGTFTMINGYGSFQGPVINSGAWITDPTTNEFSDTYTLTTSGMISMTAGDVYIFTNGASTVGSFINNSTQSNTTSLLPGKFLFDSTLSLTQRFATGGDNIGNLDTDGGFNTVTVPTLNPNLLAQYSNNFALGALELSGISTTMVFDSNLVGGRSHGGLQAALFLTNLTINPGTFLIISNNVHVYFITSNGFSAAQINLLGNGGLHQLVLEVTGVPEPSVLVLWLSGAAALYGARRRAKGQKR